jgi:hypothetical protein
MKMLHRPALTFLSRNSVAIALALVCMLSLQACSPRAFVRPPLETASLDSLPQPIHSVFLIGDCGKPSAENEPVLELLGRMTQQAGKNSTVVFLGDNAYDAGLPEQGHPDRPEMERRLLAQTKSVAESPCSRFMIPGNHDWDLMRPGGWNAVKRQEEFVEGSWAHGNTFRPDGGCPGPSVARLAPGLTLVMLDSQWWLHTHQKPGKSQGCTADGEMDFVQALRDTLAHYQQDRLIVAAHHPIWTYGTHGGHFGLKYHLFPLLMAKKNLFVPLPVLGTLAVWARKCGGTSQDCSHPRYRRYRKALREVFADHPGLIYAAGHEHNLQYNREGRVHHVVSGSGTKSQSVGHGKWCQYSRGNKGLARLDLMPDQSVVLKFILPSGACTIDYAQALE